MAIEVSALEEEAAALPTRGGKLGRLVRQFDWASTSLGAIVDWPAPLRAATNIILQSPLPMVVFWGADGVMIYNDACSSLLDQGGTPSLGQKVQQGWAEFSAVSREVTEVVLNGKSLSLRGHEFRVLRDGHPEQVSMDLHCSPIPDNNGRPGGVLMVLVETTDRVRAESRLRASEARFNHLADHAPVMIWVTDPTGACTFLSNSWYEFTGQSPEDALGFGWLAATHPDDCAAAERAFTAANAAREPFRLEYRLRRADGTYRWAIDAAAPHMGPDGEFLGYVGCVLDIEDRRATEQHLRLVINELNHRVKNTLAMIQATGIQTFRDAENLEEARDKFTGRIIALARASDLLTGERWVGASLREVISAIVDSHCPAPHRCIVDGPDVQLASKTALSLSMAMHELATNAVKYGAWSTAEGCVEVEWRVEPTDGPPRLLLEWRELAGPAVQPPKRRGFGSRLIERGLAAELGGQVQLHFAPQGLRCCVDAPLTESGDE